MELSTIPPGNGEYLLEYFLALESACFGDSAWREGDLQSHLLHHPSILVVSENTPIGYALFVEFPDEIELFRIGVVQNRRGEGIGSRILVYLKEFFKKNIFLEVREDNQEAISLYLKNNFKKVGIRKKYYNNKVDALLFLSE